MSRVCVCMCVCVYRVVGQQESYCDLTVEFTVRLHGLSMGPITTFITLIVSRHTTCTYNFYKDNCGHLSGKPKVDALKKDSSLKKEKGLFLLPPLVSVLPIVYSVGLALATHTVSYKCR